jgi:hypothetical protein
VADLLGELKEDIWQERITRFLNRYWRAMAAIFILSALVLALVVWNRTRIEVQKERAGDLYNEAMLSLDASKVDAAVSQFQALSRAATPGYRDLAQLQLGALYHKTGKPDDALKVYEELAKKGSDVLFRDMAALLAAKVRMQRNEYTEAVILFEPLTKKGRPFRFSALELTALSQLEMGKKDLARKALLQIKESEEAPVTLHQRAVALLHSVSPEEEKTEPKKDEAAE